jgi:hypothetical protein
MLLSGLLILDQQFYIRAREQNYASSKLRSRLIFLSRYRPRRAHIRTGYVSKRTKSPLDSSDLSRSTLGELLQEAIQD